jgi:hypothetical protein
MVAFDALRKKPLGPDDKRYVKVKNFIFTYE